MEACQKFTIANVAYTNNIDALCDLVSFVQFKKREKHL